MAVRSPGTGSADPLHSSRHHQQGDVRHTAREQQVYSSLYTVMIQNYKCRLVQYNDTAVQNFTVFSPLLTSVTYSSPPETKMLDLSCAFRDTVPFIACVGVTCGPGASACWSPCCLGSWCSPCTTLSSPPTSPGGQQKETSKILCYLTSAYRLTEYHTT